MTLGHSPRLQQLPGRIELRCELDKAAIQAAHDLLAANYCPVGSEDPVTTTTYLASPELELPKPYLRARKYGKVLSGEMLELDNPNETWLLEVKGPEGAKKRIQLTLGNLLVGTSYPELNAYGNELPALNNAIQEFGRPLMPYVATQAHRTHYTTPGARFTVDEQISYYGFRWGELRARRMGAELAAKLELKIEQRQLGQPLEEWFIGMMQIVDATPSPDGQIESRIRELYKSLVKG